MLCPVVGVPVVVWWRPLQNANELQKMVGPHHIQLSLQVIRGRGVKIQESVGINRGEAGHLDIELGPGVRPLAGGAVV